ncbi:hypothetical protein D7Y37_19610 [Stenotrophomonas maltophilia]|nr:hypothetical protein [Stenotrophomonas maltophilia]
MPPDDKLLTVGDQSVCYGSQWEYQGSNEPSTPCVAQHWGACRQARADGWWWIADVADVADESAAHRPVQSRPRIC